ncbi:MAG: SAM-dependent methyltransferase [Chloroflexota bacterium]|nr:MAG: SAM-dependent methyltransferase [Chloroflexota bacterium]HDD55260.1 class I SAM-dependent methyltransferase [Chloroflexota bacterium]
MPENHTDPFPDLILSYDRAVDYRESVEISDWKKDLRWKFLAALKQEGRTSLIDIGAGTGVHAQFFQAQGIEVSCIDLSPALVEHCQKKGLPNQVLSVLDLDGIGRTFNAAFALNSLLHIPSRLLPKALSNIARVLTKEGLFYWGQYGGEYQEGVYQDDTYQPKRFFSLLADDQIRDFAAMNFTIETFEKIQLENSSPLHFQSLLLRVKSDE